MRKTVVFYVKKFWKKTCTNTLKNRGKMTAKNTENFSATVASVFCIIIVSIGIVMQCKNELIKKVPDSDQKRENQPSL